MRAGSVLLAVCAGIGAAAASGPDSVPYAVDAALGFCAAPHVYTLPKGTDPVDVNVARMAEAGVVWTRDRLSWAACERAPGVYDFGRFAENVRKQRAHGMDVLTVYHDAPSWAACEGKVPRDLRLVRDFARAAAAGVPASAWEFWNEENITAQLPVWNFMAAFKAAALGFRAGNPAACVLAGSPTAALGESYMDLMFANGFVRYADVMNFHDYAPLATYREQGAAYRRALAACGAADMPYWITECGFTQDGEAATPGPLPGIFEHSSAQEALMAEYLPKSQLLRALEGAGRTFFFMFGVCSERQGRKAWGLLRRDGSPKPGCVALGEMMRAVGRAALVGELDVGPAARALLYTQPDGTQSVAYWTESVLDRETRVIPLAPENAPERRLVLRTTEGPIELSATNTVRYRHGLRGLVPVRRPVPSGRSRRAPMPPDADDAVVLRVEPVDGSYEVSGRFTRADFPADRTRVKIEVWNLSDRPKKGCVASSHFNLEGLPDEIALPPDGKVAFTVAATPKPNMPEETLFELVGTFEGKRSTPLVMPVSLTGRFLASCRKRTLDWRDVKRWKVNSNAVEKKMSFDTAEQAMRFDYVFPADTWAGRKWAYPEYALDLPVESCADGRYVEFEIKCAQDKAENDFMVNFLMVVGKDGKYQNLAYLPPSGTWERRRVPITGRTGGKKSEAVMPGDSLRALRIGGNPYGRTLTFWIRNVRVLSR